MPHPAKRLIESDLNALRDEAMNTARMCVVNAKLILDQTFGNGYAHDNPALVGVVAKIAADSFHGAAGAKIAEHAVHRFMDDLREASDRG